MRTQSGDNFEIINFDRFGENEGIKDGSNRATKVEIVNPVNISIEFD